MKTNRTLPFLMLSLGLGACLMPPQPNTAQSEPLVTDEQKDAVRAQEAQADAMEKQMGNIEEQQLEKAEQDLVKALKLALGKEPAAPGMPPPQSSSKAIASLRQAKVKMRIEAVKDQNGKAVASDFLQLTDSVVERIQVLSRKMAEKKATPAEVKEIQKAAQLVPALNDLKSQVRSVSMATMMANNQLQTSSMTTLLRVAGMIRTRKMQEMTMNDADYARVQRWLKRQRRIETVAALSMGVLATYQGVVNDNKNPEALDLLAEKALESFPQEPEVSLADARNYAKGLKGNVAKVKEQYEAMLRKVHGDERYEAQFKGSIDGMFAQAAGAENQKSVTEMAAETGKQYQADRERCYKGEAISGGSLVSPVTCKEIRAKAMRGEPMPRANEAGAGAAAEAEESGGFASLLGSLPGFNIIKASLDGVSALSRGDAAGALSAAIGLVPGGGALRDTFNQVEKSLSAPTKVTRR